MSPANFLFGSYSLVNPIGKTDFQGFRLCLKNLQQFHFLQSDPKHLQSFVRQ